MARELGIKNLKVDWGIRAISYEKRCREREEGSLVKLCWLEKDNMNVDKREILSTERECFYNNLGWGSDAIGDLYEREECIKEIAKRRMLDIEGQNINSKISNARYNKRYKDIEARDLLKENMDKIELGDSIRALVRIRCGNMEEENKYWLEEDKKLCKFCRSGKDSIEHYVKECRIVKKDRFKNLSNVEEKRLEMLFSQNLDIRKGNILIKVWKEKEKILLEESSKVNLD